jgi:hypothetical protein
MTIGMLMLNTVEAAERHYQKRERDEKKAIHMPGVSEKDFSSQSKTNLDTNSKFDSFSSDTIFSNLFLERLNCSLRDLFSLVKLETTFKFK